MIILCTKCEMELHHVVVAQDKNGIVERVKCYTCASEHKYRPDRKRAPKRGAKKSTGIQEEGAFTKIFDTVAERFKEMKPLPYSMSGSFKNEDVIDHKTFGQGVVISASHDKMGVVFSDGPRVLACNREITHLT